MDASAILEHPKSPNFMDTPAFYDLSSLGHLQLQYPQSDYDGSPMLVQNHVALSPDFSTLNLAGGMTDFYQQSSGSGTFNSPSPPRPFTPSEPVSPPVVAYNLSGGEQSSENHASDRSRRGSVTYTPPTANNSYTAPTTRSSHRFNPMAAGPVTRNNGKPAARRRSTRDDSDDEDEEFVPSIPANISGDARRETIRRQRIESEQRRRDELRDGYRRLKEALPVSNQKSSKVSLLDRSTTHIKFLEMTTQQLQARLQAAENEVTRLRAVNEALMLGAAQARHPATAASIAAAQAKQASF